jgi:hypothetical protein
VTFHVSRPDGTTLGEFSESEFKRKIFANEIDTDDFYWTEGMEDWRAVALYGARRKAAVISPPVPPPLLPVSQPESQATGISTPKTADSAKAKAKQKTVLGSVALQGFGMLFVAGVIPVLYSPLILVSVGLVLAAFVLAIIGIVRGHVATGVLVIAGCPFALMMAFVALSLDTPEKRAEAIRARQQQRGR